MMDDLIQIPVKSLKLMEEINMYIRFNIKPRGLQLKFLSNIPDLQITKSLKNCSKKLIVKIVSKYNS